MTTRRDLVQADGFSRRRLVAAFVSGAQDGAGVEPVRRGRTLAASVALAMPLMAGLAIAGVVGLEWPTAGGSG